MNLEIKLEKSIFFGIELQKIMFLEWNYKN